MSTVVRDGSLFPGLVAALIAAAMPPPALAACIESDTAVECSGNLEDEDGINYDANDGFTTLIVEDFTNEIVFEDGTSAIVFTGDGEDRGDDGFSTTLGYDDSNAQGASSTDATAIEHSGDGRKGKTGSDIYTIYGSAGDGGDGGTLVSTYVAQYAIDVTGDSAYGIHVAGEGGDGGDGGYVFSVTAGNGGDGGDGGVGGNLTVTVSQINDGRIQTDGDAAHGLFVESFGGDGGDGGDSDAVDAKGGKGGIGGDGGIITVEVDSDIQTYGDSAQTIFVQSYGGAGGDGGSADGISANGGASRGAGDGGTVTLNMSGQFQTAGDQANAILAQSIGGFAGASGSATGFVAYGANSESGGAGGAVTITSVAAADAASNEITTEGESAYGIQAQSIGGGGGRGSTAASVFTALGSTGSAGGDGGTVDVTSDYEIDTAGDGSTGLLVQSVGGGGGDSGGLGGLVTIGASGGSGGNGGNVTLGNSGDIRTGGKNAGGISAQSVGGGGGSAGLQLQLVTAIGASAGDGGNGGTVLVTNTGSVTTTGEGDEDGENGTPAVNVQSIGGGGGIAAGVVSIDAIAAVAYGGTGGDGGAGGDASYTDGGVADYTLSTLGGNAPGLLVQSLGGGGGNGGYAVALTGSPIVSVAVGSSGNGGEADNGALASIELNGAVTTQGVNSSAITAQSIGGGGGNSGNVYSGAGALVFAHDSAIGGDGGDGGSGGTIDVEANGPLSTSGDNSYGILAQAIGGGGGNAGSTTTLEDLSSVGVTFNHGGSAGGGGGGGTVDVSGTGDIDTAGHGSDGILAQSIGGGGGSGGQSVTVGTLEAFTVDLTIGGSGGSGGDGAQVTVYYGGAITTAGGQSSAITAQSIGGGGGNASLALAVDVVNGGGFEQTTGGSGGDGGAGGEVTVTYAGQASTSGDQAAGIVAQSIGQGGGNAGTSMTVQESILVPTVGLTYGGGGGGGGIAGKVSVTVDGGITTTGENAPGVVAQSLGGGGGRSGTAIGASALSFSSVDVTVGGDGGSGSSSGEVEVVNDASIETSGTKAHAIYAQSAGGGGGNSGVSIAASALSVTLISASPSVQVSVGGSGGEGGVSSAVTVKNDGQLSAAGNYAYGIYALSQGGSGGDAGVSATGDLTVNPDATAIEVGVAVGGDGGAGSIGDEVTVTNNGVVDTSGYGGHAIYAQSIGGSGGTGGSIWSVSMEIAQNSGNFSLDIGGEGGDGAVGGNVQVDNWGIISTEGVYAHGIFAQSVGGNGGHGGNSYLIEVTRASSASYEIGTSVGGDGGSGKNAGAVDVTNYVGIGTLSNGSAGIYAQSVGGGGGNAGDAKTWLMNLNTNSSLGTSLSVAVDVGGQGGSSGDGEAVTVINSGAILTQGDGADGIFAQSVGGGGGDGGYAASSANFFTIRGTFIPTVNVVIGGDGGASGDGGAVDIDNTGAIITTGDTSYGIYAQSVGGGGGRGGDGKVGLVSWLEAGQQDEWTGITADTVSDLVGIVSLRIKIGGDGGSSGDGGQVDIANEGAISTFGDGSTAIFAQSVGGGGGNGGNQFGVTQDFLFEFSGTDSGASNGGAVAVTNSALLTTSGDGAMGIFAQSVGGGGGVSGDFEASLDTEFEDLQTGAGIDTEEGEYAILNNGGDVTVETTGWIVTSGEQAHGVFAQSIAGGGGAKALSSDEIAGDWVLGTLGTWGASGDVDITTGGTVGVAVSGAGATAIFAQSAAGNFSQAGDVTMEIGGAVSASGDRGRAIVAQSVGVANDTTTGNGKIDITVTEEGSITSTSNTYETIALFEGKNNKITNYGTIERPEEDDTVGYVVRTDGISTLTIVNYGTFSGSVLLGGDTSTANSFVNRDGGFLNLGLDFDMTDKGTLSNGGTMSAAGVGTVGTSAFTGATLTQQSIDDSVPTLWVDLSIDDADELTADLITMQTSGSTASIEGDIAGTFVGTNLPQSGDSGSVPILYAADGTIEVGTVTMVDMATVTFGLEESQASDGVDETLSLTYVVDYTPESAALDAGHREFAGYVESLAALRAAELATGGDAYVLVEPLTNQILNTGRADDLAVLYQSYTPDIYFAPLTTNVVSSLDFAGSLQSCPQHGAGKRMDFDRQGNCSWMRVAGGYQERDGADGFHEDAFVLSGGVQGTLAEDLFLGLGMSYETLWLDGVGDADGSGNRVQLGSVIKSQRNDWTLSAALTGGYTWYDISRGVMTPDGTATATGKPEIGFVSLSGRIARSFELGNVTVEPAVDAGLVYQHLDGFSESGVGDYGMRVADGSFTTTYINPSVEIGTDFTTPRGSARAFARAGLLAITSGSSRDLDLSLAGLSDGPGFTLTDKSDSLYADLSVGLDARLGVNTSLQISAGALLSDDYTAFGGAAKFHIGF